MQSKSLLRAISDDRALGSVMLFRHRHAHVSPEYHVTIMDAWRSAEEFLLIDAFRGSAKSTLAEEFLLMEACYGNFFYCLLIGETYAKACQMIEAMAFEGMTNMRLRRLFGKVFAKKPIEDKLHFASGALIQALGWEQEIRGFKHHDRRPDRAYLDDIENLERVRSTEAVDATMRKISRELRPAMDPASRKIRMSQTPLAADCAVTRIRADPSWVTVSIPICNGDIDAPGTVSAWPERFSMPWIRKERDAFEASGRLRDFMQEYMLSVEDTETKPFAEEMLRYADLAPGPWLPRYAIYDPARTATVGSSCRVGKVVVSRMGSKILVHESAGAYWKPDETRADIFETHRRHKCVEVGVEKDSLDEYLMQPIRFEMLKRGVMLPIRALNAPQDRDKDQFIMGLQPFFAAGDVVLVGGRGMHGQLVSEILNFPAGKKDTLNALAYALRMFAGMPIYEDFGESNIGPAPDAKTGEKLYLAWNASATETVCAVVQKMGRHWCVARDFAQGGPTLDAVRQLAVEVRANYPRAQFESYVPGELHDQWQRIALVPALRDVRLNPFSGEHVALARGALAEKIRTTQKERRLLTVTKDAPLTLNALAAGYKVAPGKQEPEAGLSRLIAEGLECCMAALNRRGELDADYGTNARNAQGVAYRSALPSRG